MEREERWVMHGLAPENPACIHTIGGLRKRIEEIGFLPLFRNAVPGFSVEEQVTADCWWTDDPLTDPWQWRQQLAAEHEVAYGKFFGGTAGFLSLRWLPVFAKWRRDGYDFDALFDDGRTSYRRKKLMDPFETREELLSCDLKELAGFGKGGEKNFEGNVTALQEELYLVISEFRRRLNKKGLPYGWPISVYRTPESLWGYETVSACYGERPEESRARIEAQLRRYFPEVTEAQARSVTGPKA